MIEELLKFKNKMDLILNESFCKNDDLLHAFKEGFEAFINTRQNKPAELMAKFLDKKLKSGQKGFSDEEMEALLDNVMAIFRCIQGKDIFQAFYRNVRFNFLNFRRSSLTNRK